MVHFMLRQPQCKRFWFVRWYFKFHFSCWTGVLIVSRVSKLLFVQRSSVCQLLRVLLWDYVKASKRLWSLKDCVLNVINNEKRPYTAMKGAVATYQSCCTLHRHMHWLHLKNWGEIRITHANRPNGRVVNYFMMYRLGWEWEIHQKGMTVLFIPTFFFEVHAGTRERDPWEKLGINYHKSRPGTHVINFRTQKTSKSSDDF